VGAPQPRPLNVRTTQQYTTRQHLERSQHHLIRVASSRRGIPSREARVAVPRVGPAPSFLWTRRGSSSTSSPAACIGQFVHINRSIPSLELDFIQLPSFSKLVKDKSIWLIWMSVLILVDLPLDLDLGLSRLSTALLCRSRSITYKTDFS
jgi:hypothetical protein